jgi:hypothetical protein
MNFQNQVGGYNAKGTDINSVNPFKFVTQAYNGSGGFRDGSYLFPFAREFDFNSRKNQAYYENFCKGVADSLYVPVFSELADRQTNSDLFLEFIDNADNNGNHLQSIMKMAGKYATLHGISFIVMDNFEETPESLQVAIDDRIFPYIYVKTADQVEDYEIDEFGRLIEIDFCDGEYETNDDQENEVEYHAYRHWDDTQTYRYYIGKDEKKIVIGVARDHNVGKVPVIAIQKEMDTEEFLCNPPFYDIARMNCAIYNGSSELNNIQRQQAFSLLVIPSTDQNPNMEIGTNSVLCVDPQSSITPTFISPDSAIMTVVQANIDSIVKSLLDSADSLGATAVNNGNAQKSGVSMAYSFMGQNFVLTQMAQLTTKAEYQIAEMFKLYTNTTFEYVVRYESNYKPNINDVKIKYDILERMIGLDLSPAINSQLKSSAIEVLQSIFDIEEEDIIKLRQLVASENQSETGSID